MGEIYGLYSTRDGQIRFVGQTEYTARKCLDQVITKALEQEPGALFSWVQDEWRDKLDVRAHTLQDDVVPADLEMFETYWIEQFGHLLNDNLAADPQRPTSETGQRVIEAIVVALRGEDDD